MPNWCSTHILIISENKQKLKTLYDLLEIWTSKNYMNNGFGVSWLGNIVLGSGIGTVATGNETDVECRGWLGYMSFTDDNTITLQTETAWYPKLNMWKLLCEKYLPNSKIIYDAVEEGMGVYCTNDPDLIDKYYVITQEGTECDLSKDEVIKTLQEKLKTEENDFKKLLELAEKETINEDNDRYYYIYKYEEVAIEEWD